MAEHSLTWRKSSFSLSGDCLEWRFSNTAVHARDSKDPGGPALVFSHHGWRAFVASIKSGDAALP